MLKHADNADLTDFRRFYYREFYPKKCPLSQKFNETTFVNASLVNEKDELSNKPYLFEVEARR